MSFRFACGFLLLTAFIAGLLGWFVFHIVWLALGGLAVALLLCGLFFFLSLEE